MLSHLSGGCQFEASREFCAKQIRKLKNLQDRGEEKCRYSCHENADSASIFVPRVQVAVLMLSINIVEKF